MTRRIALLFALAGMLGASVVIDRIAAIVGKHAIKTSDINRDLRVTEFLNREPLNLDAAARRKSAERLIDQSIIGDEIANGQFGRAKEADAQAFLARMRQERFAGSDPRLRQALTTYGLTEDELRAHLLWQLDVLRFIDDRFRPGVLVTDEEVRSYYDQHRKEFPQSSAFSALEPKIRATLEGERVNKDFEQWLEKARQRNRVEYRQEAFQ